MKNPILATLNKSNNLLPGVNAGNAGAVYNQLMQSNPQFKQFVEQNRGKSPAQIAQENGIDINFLNSLIGQRLG